MTIVDIPPPASQKQREHFQKLLRQFSTAMLVTHADGGRLRARPMAIAQVADNNTLWFITGMETAKAHEIEQDTRVHITCQDDHSAYLSFDGRARLVDDRKKVAELWQEPFRVWFPGGQEDPNVVLIAVCLEEGEYWDHEGWNKIKYVVESAQAYVTGQPPPAAEDDSQHAFVRF
jgi:general stress protein 26